MSRFAGKKLLVLGGRPIGSREIVECAKNKGVYVIVTDYLPAEQSPAKFIADEAWNISTADTDILADKIKEKQIDGVFTGVNEFNIKKMMSLCEKTGLPCYCNLEKWDLLQNKAHFKKLCEENDIPVTKGYSISSLEEVKNVEINYPVITKPVDGSASQGFTICNNESELVKAFPKAVEFSDIGGVLVEQYMNYKESVIINYTVINGEVFYCGMSDKYSKKVFKESGPIMSFQYYSSRDEKAYLCNLDEKVRNMLGSLEFKNGVFWIEAFNNCGEFTFNEMGVRFGGSLTYLPVQYLYGFNQLDMLIEYALSGKSEIRVPIERKEFRDKIYCIFPIHVKAGIITKIEGLDRLELREELVKLVQVHYIGDKIDDWGSARQVLYYIHFIVKNYNEANKFAKWVIRNIHVYDENNHELLFNLYV